MNIDALVAKKVLECDCLFDIEIRKICEPMPCQGKFTIFVENGVEPGASIRILDEERQEYFTGRLTRFDEDGIDFEIVDLEGK